VTKSSKSKPLVEVDLIISDMSEYLVAEDMRSLAMRYLYNLGNPKQANIAFIKDRVFNSDSTQSLAKQFVRPSFPY
jgi:hypothetical protein